MPKKFSDLRAKMAPEAQARVKARVRGALAEMPLQELRRARELAQQAVGEVLGMSQPEVSKLEQRSDALISTVRRYVEAMGGELEIVARFPEGAVRITQFQDIGRSRDAELPLASGGWMAREREDRDGRTFVVGDLHAYVARLGQGTPDESARWVREDRSSTAPARRPAKPARPVQRAKPAKPARQ